MLATYNKTIFENGDFSVCTFIPDDESEFKTIFENGDFSVCTFIPDDESELPENALKYGTFVGIGNNIPHSNDIQLMIGLRVNGSQQSTVCRWK